VRNRPKKLFTGNLSALVQGLVPGLLSWQPWQPRLEHVPVLSNCPPSRFVLLFHQQVRVESLSLIGPLSGLEQGLVPVILSCQPQQPRLEHIPVILN
jgi:hypothetical protein